MKTLNELYPILKVNGISVACSQPGCKRKARHMHHKQYRSQGGADCTENLCSLCNKCHVALHSMAGDFKDWGKQGGQKTAAKMVSMPNLKQFQGEAGRARWEAYCQRKAAQQMGAQV